MSALRFHSRVPIGNDAGWIELQIEMRDIGSASERDREFIASIVDRFFALADVTAPRPPEVPAVLRGMIGGRP